MEQLQSLTEEDIKRARLRGRGRKKVSKELEVKITDPQYEGETSSSHPENDTD